LRRLAEFGRHGTGVHRLSLSAEDVASRHWLAEKYAEAGLDPVISGLDSEAGADHRVKPGDDGICIR